MGFSSHHGSRNSASVRFGDFTRFDIIGIAMPLWVLEFLYILMLRFSMWEAIHFTAATTTRLIIFLARSLRQRPPVSVSALNTPKFGMAAPH